MAFPWKAWRRYNSLAVAANKKWELYVVTFENGLTPLHSNGSISPRLDLWSLEKWLVIRPPKEIMATSRWNRDWNASRTFSFVSFDCCWNCFQRNLFLVNYGSWASCQQLANLSLWNFSQLWNLDVFFGSPMFFEFYGMEFLTMG